MLVPQSHSRTRRATQQQRFSEDIGFDDLYASEHSRYHPYIDRFRPARFSARTRAAISATAAWTADVLYRHCCATDVDPEVNKLDGIFAFYDIDDLQSVAGSHMKERSRGKIGRGDDPAAEVDNCRRRLHALNIQCSVTAVGGTDTPGENCLPGWGRCRLRNSKQAVEALTPKFGEQVSPSTGVGHKAACRARRKCRPRWKAGGKPSEPVDPVRTRTICFDPHWGSQLALWQANRADRLRALG